MGQAGSCLLPHTSHITRSTTLAAEPYGHANAIYRGKTAMLKKTVTAVGIAGLLVLGGASAAQAYPSDVPATAGDATLAPGESTTVTASDVDGDVTFSTSGPGVTDDTLSSIAFLAASGSSSVVKPANADRVATATFTAPNVTGTYTIQIVDGDGDTGSVTISVTATGAGAGDGSGGLPATGGAIPAAALWLGVGVIGMGGIAVTAAVARRRAAAKS